jgi:hypothetical protein
MEWKIVPVRNEDDQISHYLAIQREINDNQIDSKTLDTKLPL